jgi:hypothetical protein
VFTLFFSLSRLALALEIGGLYFYGLIELNPSEELGLEPPLTSFFSSIAFLNGDTYSLVKELFSEDVLYLEAVFVPPRLFI